MDRRPIFPGRIFGPGPKDVKFFFEPPSQLPAIPSHGEAPDNRQKVKGGGNGAPSNGPGGNVLQIGRYISVYDYFRDSISPQHIIRHSFNILSSTSMSDQRNQYAGH